MKSSIARKKSQLKSSHKQILMLWNVTASLLKRFWVILVVTYNPGGALPYITYTGMCRPTGLWFWSSWFRMGYPLQRRFLEWGIKNCGSRLYLLLKIVADYEEAFISCISWTNKEMSFKKTGLFQSTNFLERSIKNWPISRTGCQF